MSMIIRTQYLILPQNSIIEFASGGEKKSLRKISRDFFEKQNSAKFSQPGFWLGLGRWEEHRKSIGDTKLISTESKYNKESI
jgi:hypothetical protein